MVRSVTGLADPTPRHGDRGDAAATGAPFPRTLTVAISRQVGARGGSIARRVSRKLGWQIVDQELIEYLGQQGGAADELSAGARMWADAQLKDLQDSGTLSRDAEAISLARVILNLGAQGEVVLLGRGAGHLLPRGRTLHVRVVAPRADRLAYMCQVLRLSPAEAEVQVDLRERRRDQYLLDHFNVEAADPIHYDLVLNSSLLGEELCADLIAQAARAKNLGGAPDDAPAGFDFGA